MLMFKIILITIMSLVADSVNNKPWKGEEYVSLFRRTPIPIWRRTPLPIPIWRRTPPPIFTIRDEKIQKKSMNQTDDGKKLSMKWVVKDIYYPNKKDLNTSRNKKYGTLDSALGPLRQKVQIWKI